MGRPAVFTWQALDTAAVCALQTKAAAGNLRLNGTQVLLTPNGVPYVIFPGQSRIISLTSTANLSGVNFTVLGVYLGRPLSETIAGPNNNTVTTAGLFDSITSISVSAAVATNVSVGTGAIGATQWWLYNYHAPSFGLTCAVEVTGVINYTFLATMDDVTNGSSPTSSPAIEQLTAATTSLVGSLGSVTLPYTGAGAPTYDAPVQQIMPIRYACVAINSASAGASLVVTIIQQGTK